MITHGLKIRRQLRSIRASVLSEAERRQELREAEERAARDHRDDLPAPQASTRASGS